MVLEHHHAHHSLDTGGHLQAIAVLMGSSVVRIRQLQEAYGSGKYRVLFQYLAFAAIVFGAKLWLISTYGNQTPFWDQWDGEAEYLYKPFLDGSLTWTDLFRPHNEHYIFTTRALALGLLILNGIWNPLLQMVVNAGLHILALVVLSALLTKVIGRNCLPVLLLFAAVLFSIPYAWENTLGGFQSQFYFVLLFSILSIWYATTSRPLSPAWWLGILLGMLAFFSLASGVFTFATAGLLGLLLYAFGIQRTRSQLLASIVLLALFAAGVLLTPKLQMHAGFRASSVAQFVAALIATLAWPSPPKFYFALLRNLPALILIVSVFRARPPANDRKWFIVALAMWAIGQSFTIAYGRASSSVSSRYMDLYAVAVLVNFACLLMLVAKAKTERTAKIQFLAVIWTATVLMSFALNLDNRMRSELASKLPFNAYQETNLKNYLATNDFKHLAGKPFFHIPYPIPERLELILRSPSLRQVMPSNVRPPLGFLATQSTPGDAFVAPGYYSSTPARDGPTLGSYGPHGDQATGQASIRFEGGAVGTIVAIPIAGYPRAPGIKVEIEQNGRREPIRINANPGESWGTGYANVAEGLFTLQLTDTSDKTWVAVGAPTVSGRLDYLTNVLLSKSRLFFMIGLAIVVLIAIGNLSTAVNKK